MWCRLEPKGASPLVAWMKDSIYESGDVEEDEEVGRT